MSIALAEKYQEIETIKNKFLQKVANLNAEQLNKVAVNGGWSAGQTLYHCAFAESGTIIVMQKNLAENKVQLQSNIGSVFRNILLVVLLKLPIKFKAPKVVSSVPEHVSIKEIQDYFAKNTNDFKQLLINLPLELEDKYIFKHPRSGWFNIQQVLHFVSEHYAHHERQLDEVLGK